MKGTKHAQLLAHGAWLVAWALKLLDIRMRRCLAQNVVLL